MKRRNVAVVYLIFLHSSCRHAIDDGIFARIHSQEADNNEDDCDDEND